MNKLIKFSLCAAMCAGTLSAKIATIDATPENIAKQTQIVDIRTPAEWADTGVIKDAKLVTLVNDAAQFKAELEKAGVDLNKPVALICRSGRRSAFAASLIDAEGMDITNLDGGMGGLISKGYQTTPYSK